MELEFIDFFIGMLIAFIVIIFIIVFLALLFIISIFIFDVTRKIIQAIDNFFDNL